MNKKIIRVISFVMTLTLTFGVMAFAAEDEKAVFTAETVTVDKGEGTVEVAVPINFEGNLAVDTLTVKVAYDKGITPVLFTEPGLSTNPLTIPFASSDFVKLEEGNFATIKFEVPVDEAKVFNITVVVTEAYDESSENIATTVGTVHGGIAVKSSESDAEDSEGISVKERTADSILLKINTNLAMAFGEMVEIDNTNASVVPYIVNGRTLVPLRFVSETLGAEVEWEEGWNYCFVKKNGKAIKITFNSADIEVDGEVVTYDAPIQVVENRTMVPIRFISETLGYDVYWNEPNQIVAISPVDNPWVKERAAELSTINSMMVTLLLKRKL